jgi:hypothetical protein
MNAKVKVVADATSGAVIVVSPNNPEYGYVRLEQVRTMVDDNGFLRRKIVSTLLHGVVSELQESGFYAGQELPGTILIKESLTPLNKTNPERDYKIAGETGIICTKEGAPVYRKTVYSITSDAEDQLVQHDNIEELRNAYAKKASSASTLKANTDFDSL